MWLLRLVPGKCGTPWRSGTRNDCLLLLVVGSQLRLFLWIALDCLVFRLYFNFTMSTSPYCSDFVPIIFWVCCFRILTVRFATQCTPDSYSSRKKYVPSAAWFLPPQFGVTEESFFLERLTWEGAFNLPSLVHEFWFLVKWITTTGNLFRASIKKLSLAYDSFLGSIKCDVEYDTEYYSDDAREWRLI